MRGCGTTFPSSPRASPRPSRRAPAHWGPLCGGWAGGDGGLRPAGRVGAGGRRGAGGLRLGAGHAGAHQPPGRHQDPLPGPRSPPASRARGAASRLHRIRAEFELGLASDRLLAWIGGLTRIGS